MLLPGHFMPICFIMGESSNPAPFSWPYNHTVVIGFCKIHAISIDASVKRFEVDAALWINFAANKAKQNAA